LRALCQAVLTLRMYVLGRCGLKKTYSDIPFVAASHFESSDLTNDVIGKVRRPAVVFDCTTVIIDSAKSTSGHLSLRASIPTRIPVSRSVMKIVRSRKSQQAIVRLDQLRSAKTDLPGVSQNLRFGAGSWKGLQPGELVLSPPPKKLSKPIHTLQFHYTRRIRGYPHPNP
jgi:hypothetical protein